MSAILAEVVVGHDLCLEQCGCVNIASHAEGLCVTVLTTFQSHVGFCSLCSAATC